MSDDAARGERGFALAAALLAVALAAALALALATTARLEAGVARRRIATTGALAALDACAARTTAALAAGWDFDDVLAGPDAVAGTADDGLLDAGADCTATALPAPPPSSPPRLLLALEATAGGGRRRLAAVVGRAPAPGGPALLWLADGGSIGRVDAALALDGVDAARPDDAPLAAIAAPAAAASLDDWILAQASAITIAGGTRAPVWSPAPPLAALVARAIAAGAAAPADVLAASPPAAPALALATGDLLVDQPRAGAGLLVVDGVLSIDAPLDFAGVIAATGGVEVGPWGRLEVRGAVWIGPTAGEALLLAGASAVHADAAALEAADALLPLPRLPRLLGVRDF